MARSTVERRLRDVQSRLVHARGELTVLDEQLTVFTEIEDDKRVRSLVSETPLAVREHDEASRTAAAVARSRQALVETIGALERRRDELLQQVVTDPK